MGFVALEASWASSSLIFRDAIQLDEVHDEIQKNKILVFQTPSPGPFLEIVVPMSNQSTVANFVHRRGSGIHHFGYEVADIDAAISAIAYEPGSVLLGGYELMVPSFGGRIRTKFVHQKGTIIELLEVG